MSARGCPYSCNFCQNSDKKVDYFTASRTVDNVERLFEIGIKDVFFVDDIFTLNLQHMSDIYNECKRRGVKIENHNHFFTHISSINKESIGMMHKFSPTRVEVGIESGDDEMLRLMGKNTTAALIYKNIRLLAKYVPVHGLFLIGYPGETSRSLLNTINFVKKIRGYLTGIWVSYYSPIPGTMGFHTALKNGRITSEEINNAEIAYIDNNLTVAMLQRYRDRIFKTASKRNLYFRAVHRLKYLLANMNRDRWWASVDILDNYSKKCPKI